jgi:alkanesulfonate monooxygenase SsuD/methylene tetrahydromethanopterin reductase-like flavin-dependent oxidoreductase (luciferase family)
VAQFLVLIGEVVMKKIGFLSFGHYQDVPGSVVLTAQDALLQSIELAVAAEEVGADGAFFRVHHFAPQLASPFPLLAAIAARTSRIEIGTGVIDMRYENPLYMAEEAAAVDLISDGRLQLGISRGSPEPALRGYEAFGYVPGEGSSDADDARHKAGIFLEAIDGAGVARANTAEWAAEQGMNLMSSTLLTEDTGVPFDELQAEQIQLFRKAWADAGHPFQPRVSVSRSIMPLVTDEDRHYFGLRGQVEGKDQVGHLDGGLARFGKSYIGEPDALAEDLAKDAAIAEADTLLITVPNQLGVDYNAKLIESVVKYVAPAVGWR